jgi:hypothetical protein
LLLKQASFAQVPEKLQELHLKNRIRTKPDHFTFQMVIVISFPQKK